MPDRLPGPMLDPLSHPLLEDILAFERVMRSLIGYGSAGVCSGVVVSYLPECAGMPDQWGISVDGSEPTYGDSLNETVAKFIRSRQ